MEVYYGLAGRLIEYYRNQKYKAGDDKCCVKSFLQDENGQHICSFPTYKKIASGQVAKNEGFYYFLATKLNIGFDAPYLINDDLINKYEQEFSSLVENHQIKQISAFCDYYEEIFLKMNTSLVNVELFESLHLLSLIFDDKKPKIDVNKILALVYTSQSHSFVFCLYYLLFQYYQYYEVDPVMESRVLKEVRKLENDCHSNLKRFMDAMYERNIGSTLDKEIILPLKNHPMIWDRYLYYYVFWDDTNHKLPFAYLDDMIRLYEEMKRERQTFTRNDFLWITQLICRHCFFYGQNEMALLYAKQNLEKPSKNAYHSLLILFNIYNQQNRLFEKEWLDRFNYFNFPDLPEINIVLEYIHQRLEKVGIIKSERMIMGRLLPLYKKKQHNFFINYFFYQELILCTLQTGHEDLLKVYHDFVLDK